MTKSLIIDPGHGGTDPGAIGFGVKEKQWTLFISLYQYERLKELGANVELTRKQDQTLDPGIRANLVKNKYDYCMSNHFNAFNGKARGVETIHSIYANDKIARKLATTICSVSGLPFRRVFSRKGSNGKDYYFMHRDTGRTETIIVEYGFIDNVDDHNFYENTDNMIKVAEAVIKVWCEILGVTYRERKPQVNKPNKQKLYKVQVGAFADKKNAEALAKKLKSDGYPTYIVES